jgi:hypothetical protein
LRKNEAEILRKARGVNKKQIGDERISGRGYLQVKYSDRPGPPNNRWKGKHVLIWEKAHGPVPEGHVVIFTHGNKQNFGLDNLVLVTKRELRVINCPYHGMTRDKGRNMAVIALAKLRCAAAEKKREMVEKGGRGKPVYVSRKGSRCYVVRGGRGYYAVSETPGRTMRIRALKTRKTLAAARRDLKERAIKMGWMRE